MITVSNEAILLQGGLEELSQEVSMLICGFAEAVLKKHGEEMAAAELATAITAGVAVYKSRNGKEES